MNRRRKAVRKPTLMTVDDSLIVRRKIERSLGDTVDVVASASDGKEAIEMFEKHLPDIVTMDLTMPRMDGATCISELKKRSNSVAVLVISALSDQSTALDAVSRGAVGFLLKPFSDDELVNAIERIAKRLKS